MDHREISEMELENPWNIQSLYELQYFNCPSCDFKNHFKQDFINHAIRIHPEQINQLKKIKDDSLSDIIFPDDIIKTENSLLRKSSNEFSLVSKGVSTKPCKNKS